jgi:Fe-Mn family superoxide dismutase
MTYSIRPLPFDPSRLDGLSVRLIESHHRNNYGGAVSRLNTIRESLAQFNWFTAPGFQVGSLKREELIAANSAFLHELYFDSLGAIGELPKSGLGTAFVQDFGSVAAWQSEFVAIGRALRGGSGWALCSWSVHENRLVNHWSADHPHVLAGAIPIIARDMYEHAYHIDYGADANTYVDEFMRNINWINANERYVVASGGRAS